MKHCQRRDAKRLSHAYVALFAAASPVGAAVTFPITSTLSVETEVAYRRGEGGIHAMSMSTSLLYFLPRRPIGAVCRRRSWAANTGARVHFNGPPIGTQPRLSMTVNAGAGLKIPMNEKLDLRTDARWVESFGRQGSEQYRVAQGISSTSANSSVRTRGAFGSKLPA